MAWSWSHTNEAYAFAEARCRELDHETLATIYAEWRAYRPRRFDQFDDLAYPALYNAAVKLPTDVLAREVWDRANDQRTCDNGGWNAWLCPFGCGCHTVPFGP